MSIQSVSNTAMENVGLLRVAVSSMQAATKMIARVAEQLSDHIRAMNTRSEMRRLDKRLLRDINLTKADVELRYPTFPSEGVDWPLLYLRHNVRPQGAR